MREHRQHPEDDEKPLWLQLVLFRIRKGRIDGQGKVEPKNIVQRGGGYQYWSNGPVQVEVSSYWELR